MCRTGESRIGSYAGRIAPPGIPKMTSTPSCSSERIMACAPVIFTTASLPCSLVVAHPLGGAADLADHVVRGRDPHADRGEVLQVDPVCLVGRRRERIGDRDHVVVEP